MSLPLELQSLCREFDRERPSVLVVVGAGVSFGATGEARASWRGLLEHGVATLRENGCWDEEKANANLTLIKNAFSSAFDLDEVLGRAESIAKALGAPNGPDYSSWLAGAIGNLKSQVGRTATLDAIAQLEQAGALILTTNYDDILSDATGLVPVTWQDHREFLRVLNRDREGILHIHGHWLQPSSVILGRNSYERILGTPELQDIFKSIWLHWSWLYVGCGNGLDDLNVGRLLRWGNAAFGDSAHKHYFLAQAAIAADLSGRPDKPANLVPIGYRDHADLPDILLAMPPRQRPWPFAKLGPTGGPVRHPSTSPLDIPLPSWEELLAGEVPALAADATVAAALWKRGWALVYDVASVGKTTLALRLAAAAEHRGCPAFYLDLARIDASDEDECARIRAAVRRLAHAKALIVLDNAHWAPQLTWEAWDWWLGRPRTSHMLILATRIQYTAGTAGHDALTVVERHPDNPAIAVRPAAADFLPLLNYIVTRICGRRLTLQPSDAALAAWHATFACEMGAFAAAVSGNHHRLMHGDWELQQSAAAEWIRNRHLRPLTLEERDNLVCLSVFATQALELDVVESALPHPGSMANLLRRGLVERKERGRERYLSYAMREADWGALLLAAIASPPDQEAVMLETACRHVFMALVLSSRLFRRGDSARLAKLWGRLRDPRVTGALIDQLMSMPLSVAFLCQAHAAANAWPELGDRLLDAWQANPSHLAERVFETPLNFVAAFVETASAQKRLVLVDVLWATLEADVPHLAERAFETPLDHLATFIGMASAHKRSVLVDALWEALEADAPRLAERAFEAPLDHLATFIGTGSAQKRSVLVDALWEVLEADASRLAERAFKTPLDHLATFIDTASAHKRSVLVDALWEALEADAPRLAERAFETPLDHLATFIDTASARKQLALVDALWAALEKEPERLQAAAAALNGGNLRAFLLRAPEVIGRLAIARLDLADLSIGGHELPVFWGAPRLATQFATLGRDDLAAELRRHLLHSADSRWFRAPYAAILDVAILLNNVAATEPHNIETFVDKICTRAWLAGQYGGTTNDAVLASALVLLALSQPPSILRRFWSPVLSRRVESALAGLSSAEGEALTGHVQLLGAAGMIGRRIPRQPFAAARLGRIARLPSDVLPHRLEVDGIEPYQRNLWLGMRVVANLSAISMQVGSAVINETLRRWRIDLQNSAKELDHTPHRLDQSMISWLQACASEGRGVLLPCREPLWLITGFGHDPKLA